MFLKKNKFVMFTYSVIKNFIRIIKNKWQYYRRQIIVVWKLWYIVISKSANSSLRKTMAKYLVEDVNVFDKNDYSIHNKIDRNIEHDIRDWVEYFSIVRNPFDRIVSAYQSKFHTDIKRWIKFHLRYYLFWIFSLKDTFQSFVYKISYIPDFLSDTHFKSQYSLLYNKWKLLADYVWKFENLDQDFKYIRHKYDLDELPHFNKSKKGWDFYMDRYTPILVEKIYKRYNKDIHTFWYYKDYLELRNYVKLKFERKSK